MCSDVIGFKLTNGKQKKPSTSHYDGYRRTVCGRRYRWVPRIIIYNIITIGYIPRYILLRYRSLTSFKIAKSNKLLLIT